MATNAADTVKEPQKRRDSQREQTRERMLQAVLDIIVEQGMRAVRHRAVAKRAGVSLGSTTYHFSSIEDLIISAFHYWRQQKMIDVNPYFAKIEKRLTSWVASGAPQSERQEVAQSIYRHAVGYIRDQLVGKRHDRLVELAFYNESIRSASLRELWMKVRRVELDRIEEVYRIMGSDRPMEDARITFTVFRQLEQAEVMANQPEPDMDLIRRVINRHLGLIFGLKLAMEPVAQQ